MLYRKQICSLSHIDSCTTPSHKSLSIGFTSSRGFHPKFHKVIREKDTTYFNHRGLTFLHPSRSDGSRPSVSKIFVKSGLGPSYEGLWSRSFRKKTESQTERGSHRFNIRKRTTPSPPLPTQHHPPTPPSPLTANPSVLTREIINK